MHYQLASLHGPSKIHPCADIEAQSQKVIYASYKPQIGQSIENAVKSLNACLNHWLECSVDDQYFKIGIHDLLQLKPVIIGQEFYIPLCAIVSTLIDFNRFPTRSLHAFLSYEELTPSECMLQHQGFLVINSQDNFWSNRNYYEGWKEFIDTESIITLAGMEHQRSEFYKTISPDYIQCMTKAIY